MIISIASGKGGTGKTTISTNLALSLGENVKLLDCDVEEPNAHLFIKPHIEQRKTVHTFVPSVDEARCNGCKKCAEICRFNALTVIGKKVMVFPELCHSCEGCLKVCDQNAILPGSRELGFVEKGSKDDIRFVQGCMRIGEAMSPPLIKKVREEIEEDELAIIDAPPGTSCPVITSMRNTDFVLLVTEPTPFGLHDLTLAVEAVKLLGIPCGIVINRANMGDKKVHEYAKRENIPILMEIPFDRKIAEIYSHGKILVEEMPSWRDAFRQLQKNIVNIVEHAQVSQ
ncbi:MAG: (4Fe-4S)-binding protein [Desulfobacterales bacterium]|nr:MAG: (4Fe-4S)-binding protein [Desulfobacterales bacterium]